MRIEYPTSDLNDKKSIQAFSNQYVKGDFQSCFAKMLYFVPHDHSDFLLYSVLDNVTPTGKYVSVDN